MFGSKQYTAKDAYLGIINFACTEQSLQGVVTWDKESGKVHKKVAGDVEENKEEVDADETEKGVDLRHRGLLFKVVEHRIFGQLSHSLINTVLSGDDDVWVGVGV